MVVVDRFAPKVPCKLPTFLRESLGLQNQKKGGTIEMFENEKQLEVATKESEEQKNDEISFELDESDEKLLEEFGVLVAAEYYQVIG